MNTGPLALTGLGIILCTVVKSLDFLTLPQKLGAGPAQAWALIQKSGSGPSKKHGPRAGPGLGLGPDPSLASIEIFPTILPVLAPQYKVPLCRQGTLKMSNRAEKLGKHVQPFMQSLLFVWLKNTHCIFHLLEKCKLRSFQRTCFTYRLHR